MAEPIELSEEVIEAAAKAAWIEYMHLTTFEIYCEERGYSPDEPEEVLSEVKIMYNDMLESWPDTRLYPGDDDFKRCAKAAILSYLNGGK